MTRPFELIALEAAARAIEIRCNRSFAVAGSASARLFTARYRRELNSSVAYSIPRVVVEIDDTFDDEGDVVVNLDTTGNGDWGDAVTTFRMTPFNNADKGRPFTGLLFDVGTAVPIDADSVKVTAAWGWDAIPNTVRQANLIQAARFLKRRDAAFGVAGSPEMGNEMRLLDKLDPDVALMLSGFRRYY